MSSALLGRPQPQSQAPADEAPLEPTSLTSRKWAWPSRRLGLCGPVEGPAPAWILGLLGQRGLSGDEAVHQFLQPSLRHLPDPVAMADLAAALRRLSVARARKEAIWIYGDYDVDGVCATAILLRFLRAAGCKADFYIPHRQKEGYGLNAAAVAELAERGGLLVTVDCGSTSHAELAAAKAAGLDAIVVDHHQLAEELPAAVALLNPQRQDCGYAGGVLCAAGLAFMLVVALRRAWRQDDGQAGHAAGTVSTPSTHANDYDVRRLLDLVALATVADMVPLVGINRILLHAGLARMRTCPCPGVAALAAVAKTPLGQLDAAALGFRLAPRINARGRMDHAGMAVELMLADTAEEARPMAQALDEANEARRTLEKQTVAAAKAQVAQANLQAHNVLVVQDPQWHPGVLGLVASRLSQQYFRPAVVIGEGGKGSARSVPGFHLVHALAQAEGCMERFGGHPAAAGLTLKPGKVQALREALHKAARDALGPAPYVPVLRPELEVDGRALGHEALAQLQTMAPFGKDNPEVLLAAADVNVLQTRCVGEDHLKLSLALTPDAAPLDGIAFGLGHLWQALPPRVDVLFYLERNVWRDTVRLQARVVDLRASSRTPLVVGGAVP